MVQVTTVRAGKRRIGLHRCCHCYRPLRPINLVFLLLGLAAFQWWIWTLVSSSSSSLLCPVENDSHPLNNNKPRDICFVTCIFGKDIQEVDQPANVEWYSKNWCNVQFLLVTNLPTLSSPGWDKRVFSSTSNDNYIVESRQAKFLAWKVLPGVAEQCQAVVYFDGYLKPKIRHRFWELSTTTTLTKFQTIVRQVQNHPWGLSQVKQKYFNGLSMTTILNNLVRDRKDTVEHVNATITWLKRQDDYEEVMTYYLNKYFAYDPNNANYRKLSSWFWEQYTTYSGLWRDQPLWAYTLHHFNCTPAIMTSTGTITKGGDLFETGGRMGWDNHVYV